MKIFLNLWLIFFPITLVAQPVGLKSLTAKDKLKICKILEHYTGKGMPGVSISVKTADDEWTASAGLADIEKKQKLTPDNLMYSQSVTKTYLAVLVLKLWEEGLIFLDSTINNYLPDTITDSLVNSGIVTVRMLLNHKSGYYDYAFDSSYVYGYLFHQTHVAGPGVMLSYVYNHPPEFKPGTEFGYSDTNYLLLALIADHITGDHADALRAMLHRHRLDHTFYKEPGYLDNPMLVSSYLDRYGNGHPEDVTRLQKLNVATMIGDDGLIATPVDYVRFLYGLMHGDYLDKPAMDLLTLWVTDDKGRKRYGMGLVYNVSFGSVAYGHSGGGLGAGCILYYFPDRDLAVFLGVNFSTLIDGPNTRMAYKVMKKTMKIVLK